MEVNADLAHVDSDIGIFDEENGSTVRDGVRTRDEGNKEGWKGLARKFFHLKVSLKKLET